MLSRTAEHQIKRLKYVAQPALRMLESRERRGKLSVQEWLLFALTIDDHGDRLAFAFFDRQLHAVARLQILEIG